MKSTWLAILILSISALAASVQEPAVSDPSEWFKPEHAEIELLILGTFHFKDAGRDGYKPEIDVDILSARRQAELKVLLNQLSGWEPTKILVERETSKQKTTDEQYRSWLAGETELGANEIYQVGFRLAKRLGLEGVHNIDAEGRRYPGISSDLAEYAARKGQKGLLDSPWTDRYEALYKAEDYAKADRTLSEHLRQINDPETHRVAHGHYVLRELALGSEGEYPATDHLTGWWYNRNIRIFSNLWRVAEPGDRILLVIGNGHVPILRHLADSSPEVNLNEVSGVLGRSIEPMADDRRNAAFR